MDSKKTKYMRSDFGGFMKSVQRQVKAFNSGVRKEIYSVAEQAAAAIDHLIGDDDEFREFLQDPYFKSSRKKVKRPGPAVLRYINEASDRRSRERCDRHGLAVEVLLLQGVAPDKIAEQLSEQGGIMAVFAQRFDTGDAEAVETEESEDAAPVEDVDDEEDGDDEEVDQEPPAQRGQQRAKDATEEQSRRSQGGLVIPPLEPGFTYVCLKVRDEHVSRFTEVGLHNTRYKVLEGVGFREAVPLTLDGEDLTDDDEA